MYAFIQISEHACNLRRLFFGAIFEGKLAADFSCGKSKKKLQQVKTRQIYWERKINTL